MRGGKKTIGKRNLSGPGDELEEYFAEFESEEPDEDTPQPNTTGQDTANLSTAEEFRRLSAYVAHLRERVSELQQPQGSLSAPRKLSDSAGTIVRFAVMVGVAAALGIIARRLSRFG